MHAAHKYVLSLSGCRHRREVSKGRRMCEQLSHSVSLAIKPTGPRTGLNKSQRRLTASSKAVIIQ